MKIAIDLHGTFDKSKAIQQFVLNEICEERMRNQIFILSGSPAKEIKQSVSEIIDEIAIHKPSFSKSEMKAKLHVLSVVDTCRFFGIPMIRIPKNGEKNWYCDDSLWWPMKAIICKENNIDVLLDDKTQYLDFFGPSHKTKMILITEENIEKINLSYITDALKNSYK